MPSTRTLYSALLCGYLTLCLVGCDSNDARLPDSVEIGAAIPLSGPVGSIGVTMQNALMLAQEDIAASGAAGTELRFIVRDTESTPATAAQVVGAFIDRGNRLILGPATSGSMEEATGEADAGEAVLLSPTASAAGLAERSPWAFTANLSNDVVIPGGVRLTQNALGYTEVALVTDTDDLFSVDAASELRAAFQAEGVTLTTDETTTTTATDFTTQIQRIAASDVDAVFLSVLPGQTPAILTQLRAAGVTARVLIPLAFSSDEATLAGDAAEGVVTFSTWIAGSDAPGNRDFVARYAARFGAEPNRFATQWYASAHLLAHAIRRADSTEPREVRATLASLSDVDTVLGPFTFAEDGSAIFDPILLTVSSGSLVPFE